MSKYSDLCGTHDRVRACRGWRPVRGRSRWTHDRAAGLRRGSWCSVNWGASHVRGHRSVIGGLWMQDCGGHGTAERKTPNRELKTERTELNWKLPVHRVPFCNRRNKGSKFPSTVFNRRRYDSSVICRRWEFTPWSFVVWKKICKDGLECGRQTMFSSMILVTFSRVVTWAPSSEETTVFISSLSSLTRESLPSRMDFYGGKRTSANPAGVAVHPCKIYFDKINNLTKHQATNTYNNNNFLLHTIFCNVIIVWSFPQSWDSFEQKTTCHIRCLL